MICHEVVYDTVRPDERWWDMKSYGMLRYDMVRHAIAQYDRTQR